MAQILLVQRETDMRKLLRMVLRPDYSVRDVSGSDDALAYLKGSAVPLVVILGDWPPAWSEEILRVSEHDPELQRHVYLLVSTNYDALLPEFRALLERLSVRVIGVPFELSELREMVGEASALADAAGDAAASDAQAHA